MAAAAGTFAAGLAEQQVEKFDADPWGYSSQLLIRGGVLMVVAGFGMGTAGYFLSASATKAANQEKQVISNIGTIFSNIKAPSWSPAASGTAPISASLQGIQNFASNAWQDLQAGASDVAGIGAAIGTAVEDAGNGIFDVAKASLSFTMHFPDILWNGLVWGVGGAIADFLNWVFPYLMILGTAMLLLGIAIALASRAYTATVKVPAERSFAKWAARREGKTEAFFDRLFRNPAAEAPPFIDAGPAAEPEESEPETVGGGVPPEPVVAADSGPASPEPEEVPAPPAEASPPTPPPKVEVHVDLPAGVATKAELEAYLGDRPNRVPTPEELAQMLAEAEANRQATLPPEPRKKKGVSGYDESRRAAEAFAAAEAA